MGPFPSLPILCSIRGEGTPNPTNPSHHSKKQMSELFLKWLLKEDRGRRPTAASIPVAAAARPHVVVAPVTKAAASPCPNPAYVTAARSRAVAAPCSSPPDWLKPPPRIGPGRCPLPRALLSPMLNLSLSPSHSSSPCQNSPVG